MPETYDVFEHSQEDGGYAGIRTFSNHKDSSNDLEVIAHGVTLEEAQNLASCTPEISRFTAAVEMAFRGGNDSIDLMIFKHELFNTLYAINEDRRRRKQNGLEPSGNFIVIKPDDDNTLKNRIFKAILKTFLDPLGNVGNLDLAGKVFFMIVISTH